MGFITPTDTVRCHGNGVQFIIIIIIIIIINIIIIIIVVVLVHIVFIQYNINTRAIAPYSTESNER